MANMEHPYPGARERDGIVYVSGAAALDDDDQPIRGDRECLDNALAAVRSRLAELGLGLDSVTKTTYFATDVALRPHANEQYVEAFAEPRPARTFVVVADLPYHARVAIEAVAHRPTADAR